MRYRNPFLWTSLYVSASILSNQKANKKHLKCKQKATKKAPPEGHEEDPGGCFFAHIPFGGNQQLINLDQTKRRPN